MTTHQSTGIPVTVEGVDYVIKVGGAHPFRDRLKEMKWYVVAFTRDHSWRHVPLAGPFETRAKAVEAFEASVNQDHWATQAQDAIVRARKSAAN